MSQPVYRTSIPICPYCKRFLYKDYGYSDSKVLVVLYKPFWRQDDSELDIVITNLLFPELERAGFGKHEIRITSLWKHSIKLEYYKEPNHFEWHLLETIKRINSHDKVVFFGRELPKIFIGDHITDAASIFGMPMSNTKYFRDKTLLFGPSLEETITTSIGEFRDVVEQLRAA